MPVAQLHVGDLRESFLAAPVALVLVDADGTIVAANDAAAGLVGAAGADELTGLPLLRFGAPEVRELAGHRLRDLTDGLVEGYVSPSLVERLDGTSEQAYVWARRVDVAEGPNVVMAIVPVRSRASEPSAVPSGAITFAVVTTDHDWRVVGGTSDTERLLDVTREELNGQGLLGLVHPLDAGKASLAFSSLGHDGRTVTVAVRLRGHGGWRDVLLTVAKLCAHEPPRLACLLSPRWSAATAPPPGTPEPVRRLLSEVMEGGAPGIAPVTVLEHAEQLHNLTIRQWEIVARLIQGQTVREIASGMYLSPSTVRNHLAHTYRKFGVHSQAGLLRALYAGGSKDD